MATSGVSLIPTARSLPASTQSGDELERLPFHAGTSSMRLQLVTLNRLPGAQEKKVHRCCAVGGDMQTLRLVVPAGASHADSQRRDLPATSWDPAQAGQTARARTLDEAIARNLKELGYGG
jgi:hypothetical protein